MNILTLSGKGWVVIPQELRRRYGLKKGDRVHVVDYGGVISIVPASESPIDSTEGMLRGEKSLVKALIKSRQEDADREKEWCGLGNTGVGWRRFRRVFKR